MTPEDLAEEYLCSLGISTPSEIDIEAIAFDAGVTVVYDANLTGCEASLIGYSNQGIATIKSSSSRGRERFSIAHELGHWALHKGQQFYCRGSNENSNNLNNLKEKEADIYASRLLMPKFLFNPLVEKYTFPSFKNINEIANDFDVSILAATLRLVQANIFPIYIACYEDKNYKWSFSSELVPSKWKLNKQLDEDSFAYELSGNTGGVNLISQKQPAEVWFSNDHIDEYEVRESSIVSYNGTTLVLICLVDDEMLEVH